MSFGYSYGAPKGLARNFNARNVPNPEIGKKYRKGQSGKGKQVRPDLTEEHTGRDRESQPTYSGPTGKDKRLRDEVIRSLEGSALCAAVKEAALHLVNVAARAVAAADSGTAGSTQPLGDGLQRIGVGCQGGKHRSVAIVEYVSAQLGEIATEGADVPFQVLQPAHRDISKPLQ